jgi:hypothetical protein
MRISNSTEQFLILHGSRESNPSKMSHDCEKINVPHVRWCSQANDETNRSLIARFVPEFFCPRDELVRQTPDRDV